jgi:sugar phosphate isomerase/epimerase
MKKPISVQLYSVREQAKEDFLGTLKRIADIGYAGVEFAGLHGHEPKEIKKVLDDLGMRAATSHGGLATEENVQEIVETAQLFEAKLVISGWKREDWASLDGIRRAAEAYQKAAALLAPHGIRMGYHNHWWEMQVVEGRYGLEHFLELAPDVEAQIDTYWACNFGAVDVPALVKKWSSRASTLHIKDGPLVEGEPHTAVGAGKMDVPAVINAADESRLEWLVVELDDCATDMMTAVADSYKYLVSTGLGFGSK